MKHEMVMTNFNPQLASQHHLMNPLPSQLKLKKNIDIIFICICNKTPNQSFRMKFGVCVDLVLVISVDIHVKLAYLSNVHIPQYVMLNSKLRLHYLEMNVFTERPTLVSSAKLKDQY
uniref:Uncharacterized protein n=1 Tax=Cacopsylla melanoneura TaxID=428564 RepID=A0A8D9EBM9_9HEMI